MAVKAGGKDNVGQLLSLLLTPNAMEGKEGWKNALFLGVCVKVATALGARDLVEDQRVSRPSLDMSPPHTPPADRRSVVMTQRIPSSSSIRKQSWDRDCQYQMPIWFVSHVALTSRNMVSKSECICSKHLIHL